MNTRLTRFSEYVLKHRVKALALTFVTTFIPVLGVLSILIAAYVTLVRGAREGAIFTVAATLPFLVTIYTSNSGHADVPLVYWAAVGVAVLSNVLTWVFAVLLERKANFSLIFQMAALFGVLVVSVIHLIYPDVAHWWGNQLQSYYEHATSASSILKVPAAKSMDAQLEMIQMTKQYATGLMTAAILFNALMQLIMARWWQSRVVVVSPPFQEELHHIRLSQLASVLFICSLLFAYLRNSVVLDMMPILFLLFAAAGLSLVHFLFSLMKTPTKWFWLLILYVTILFTIPMSIIAVAIAALLDVWLDIRKRVVKV